MYRNTKSKATEQISELTKKIKERIPEIKEEYRKSNLEISEVEKSAKTILQQWMSLKVREAKLLEGISEMEQLKNRTISLRQEPNRVEIDHMADDFETLNINLQKNGENIQVSLDFNIKDAVKFGIVKFCESETVGDEKVLGSDDVNIVSRIPMTDLKRVQGITGLVVAENMVLVVWHKTENDTNSYITKITFDKKFSVMQSILTTKFLGVELYGIGLLSTGEIISTDNNELIVIKNDQIVAKNVISGDRKMQTKAYMRDITILNDEIFATDIANHFTYNLRKDGKIVRYFGSGKLNHPMEVEVAENGRLLVRDVDGLKAFKPNGDLIKSQNIPNIKFRRGLSIKEKEIVLYVTETDKNEVLKFFHFETLVQCNEIEMNKAYCIYDACFLPNGNVVFVDEEQDNVFHLKVLKL